MSQISLRSLSLEVLESEVLRLPDRVVASLDADAERDAAWDAVAARRDAEIEAGTATEISVDEVLARLEAELK